MANYNQVNEVSCSKTGMFATVLLDNFCTLDDDQLRQSSGVRLVDKTEQKSAFYLENSCVPMDVWANITGQIRIWQPDLPLPPSKNIVGLFNLEPGLRQELLEFMMQYRNAPPLALVSNQPIIPIRNAIRRYLYQRFALNDLKPDLDSLGFNSPNLLTVTIDRKIGLKIGLHYDSWYGPTANDKAGDYFRVVVNLGSAPRWFLYAPIPFETFYPLWAEMRDEKREDGMIPITEPGVILQKLNPGIHCLKINPGQGYIADTESIIHDATTLWTDQPNVHYQLLGKFSWQINTSVAFSQDH